MNAVVNKVMENKQTRKGKLIFCQFKSEIAHLKNELSAGFNVRSYGSQKERQYAIQSPISREDIASIIDAKTTSIGAGASNIASCPAT